MMNPTERLYNLLPSLYQTQDLRQGGELRALLALLDQELQILETDIEGLYDNWFIETCDEWVVPYIGDLLDVQRLSANGARSRGQERRAYVANTLAYRRRKGTTTVLEQLALNVSGWGGRAVEFSELLARTHSLMLGVPSSPNTVDLRQAAVSDRLGSAFGAGAYTAEIRSLAQGGRYHPSKVGLFLWRLSSYPIERVTARRVEFPSGKLRGHCYHFDPLGKEIPLFNQPQTKTDITLPTQAIHVADRLLGSTLNEELSKRRADRIAGKPPNASGYFGETPVLQIFIDGQTVAISPEQILITTLDSWEADNWQLPTIPLDRRSDLRYEVAIDPELGRLAFLTRPLPRRVEVSYSYGFSGDIGGGSYDRRPSLSEATDSPNPVIWTVQQEPPFNENALATAIATWHRTTEVWQRCREGEYVSIAQVKVSAVTLQDSDIDQDARSPAFIPGVMQGLAVLAPNGSSQAIVGVGRAIDGQGRLLKISDRQGVPLEPYKNQTVLLVISYYKNSVQMQAPPSAIVEVIPASNAALLYSDRTYIRLGLLEIDAKGRVVGHSPGHRKRFRSGIVNGLTVKLNDTRNGAIITSGLAVNAEGQRIRLDINYRLNLSFHRDQPMALLISRRLKMPSDRDQPRGQPWNIELIAEANSANYSEGTFLRLAMIDSSPMPSGNIEIQPLPQKWLTAFNPGVVRGLRVIAHPGQNRAIVMPGLAVTSQGEAINITDPERLTLRSHAYQTVHIVLSYESTPEGVNWQCNVTTIVQPIGSSILLATLELGDEGRLVDLVRTEERSQFKPGIIGADPSAFRVTEKTRVNQAMVTISPGRAVDRQGRLIHLDRTQAFDLSDQSGQTVILFAAHHFPYIIDKVVAEAEVGVIKLKDNATYGSDDLTIKIPAGKQLQIVAANGSRPHVRGNLSVQGITQPSIEPGELVLEGLLIEGKLTVLPGNLKRLGVRHCTLVPDQGGLVVAPLPSSPQSSVSATDEWSIIAIAMYYVNILWQILGLNLDRTRSSAQILSHLVQFGFQKMTRWISNLWQSLRSWECSQSADRVNPDANNDQLQITIEHSICGTIYLSDTISQLVISDSIIDADLEVSGRAIIAPNTAVSVQTTTIIGSTMAFSLEASNSLFTDRVTVWRRQIGCMSFCYLPHESQTPRRYRCQPDQALLKHLTHLPARVTSIAGSRNRVLLAGTAGNGIFRSQDSGETWQNFSSGLTNQHINALAIDPDNSTFYAGATDGYLFRYDSIQARWMALIQLKSDVAIAEGSANTTHINTLIIKQGQLFAGTLGGRIFRSSDWQASQTGLENAIWNINTLAIHPQNQWIFMGTAGTGVYYSPDNGESWHRPANLNLINQNITAMAISNDGKIFVGTMGISTQKSGVFRSEDNGGSWIFITDSENVNVNTIVIDSNSQSIFVGTTHRGGLKSLDRGSTWKPLKGLSNHNITAFTISPEGQLFAGTAGGEIWRSHDQGDNWFAMNSGLDNVEEKARILAQLQPNFNATHYGDPGYAQLSFSCASEIRTGADDGSEMGSFNALKQAQREANLRTSLDEYLRFGLEADILYIT